MEKRQRRILILPLSPSWHLPYFRPRKPVTPAAAERQERSDRVSEEAEYHPVPHILLTPGSRIFLLPHEALH
jgi:hypothetical protein